MFVFCTTHYAPHKIVLELGEAEVTSLRRIDFKALTGTECVVSQLVGFLIVPTSRAIIIVFIITVICLREFKYAQCGGKLNVNITIANVIFILINGNEGLNVNRCWTNISLHGKILPKGNIRLGHVYLARILEDTRSSCIDLETFARVERKISNQLISLFIVPTGRAVIIIFVLAIVGVTRQKNAKRALELNIDVTIADIVAFAVIRNEFGEFKTTTADCIKRADLLREVFADALILVADYVSRFNAETYCGAVSYPRQQRVILCNWQQW